MSTALPLAQPPSPPSESIPPPTLSALPELPSEQTTDLSGTQLSLQVVVDQEDPYQDVSANFIEFQSHSFLCGRYESEDQRFERVLATTSLTRMQKHSIRRRFLEILRDFRIRCRAYSLLFHVGHFTITVGSLIVPALLSVQYASAGVTFIDANNFQAQVYWTTWILSLLVTMFNGVLVLFKVDMKYYFLHTTLERLRSEGWQYLQLTGRYGNGSPTHKNQFKFFCHYIEKLKLKQVEEEYYKYEDSQKNASNPAVATAAGATTAATAVGATTVAATALPAHFYPPSLQKNLSSLAEQAPPSIQDAIRGLVRQQPANQIVIPSPQTIAAPTKGPDAIRFPLPMQSPLRQSTT